MRDEDGGDPDLFLDPSDLDLKAVAEQRVDRGQRLVEQKHLRLCDQRAGERGPLLLPAGELGRIHPGLLVEPDNLQDVGRLFADQRLVGLLDLKAERDIPGHSHIREEAVLLEDHPDIALPRINAGDVRAVEQDASFRHLLEAGKAPEQRALAAAGRTEECDQFPFSDR